MISFKADTHEYFTEEGRKLYGVTHILQEAGLIDLSKVPSDILERALLFGTAMHKATELYDNDNLNEKTLDPSLRPFLDGWIKFKKETGFQIIEVEKHVVSLKYGYAGTPDRIGILRDKITVVDLKSGDELLPSSAIQTSAYENAYNEHKSVKEKARQRQIVRLYKDGTYKLASKDFFQPSDFSVFVSALTLVNFKKQKGL